MRRTTKPKKIEIDLKSPSAVILVLANLIPFYGVLFLGWKVFSLLFLFWLENVFVGIFNLLKMIACNPGSGAKWLGKIFFVPFFFFHYGIFTTVHGIFVIGLFGDKALGISGFSGMDTLLWIIQSNNLQYAALMLFFSHGFSFLWNYLGQGEYERTDLPSLMGRPYGRVVVLHITIIFGGFLLMALNSPAAGLLLFIVLKILMDLAAHFREHKKKTDA